MPIKQVIVVRKDLNMRKGKIAAQAGHAILKVFLDRMVMSFQHTDKEQQTFECTFTPAMLEWCNWKDGKPGFTKIVVGCKNEAELYAVRDLANRAGIINALIQDNGVTEFHGALTPTCICLGPDEAEKIDLITKDFPLL